MSRHVAIDAPRMEALVESAICGIGTEIGALKVPGLRGVVLGGGYARGEGGVIGAGTQRERLSNDLDFHAIAHDGAASAVLSAIDEALRPVSERWTSRLGVDVDFSPAKTVARMIRDHRRLMVQELVRACCDVAGESGESMFAAIPRIAEHDVPWTEAARFVANRGYGLLLAMESADPVFAARNIAKCVLSCGDALLVVRHAYRYKASERAAAAGSAAYAAALAWKYQPTQEPPIRWEEARTIWLDAERKVEEAGRTSRDDRRTLREGARWIVRRRSIGPLRTIGLDCISRLMREVRPFVEARRGVSPALRRDWEVFN